MTGWWDTDEEFVPQPEVPTVEWVEPEPVGVLYAPDGTPLRIVEADRVIGFAVPREAA